jgi:hypothetical protein
MTHREIAIIGRPDVSHQPIFHKDNNLDKRDNIDELADQPAVYAICGRVNGNPVNCRFVGATDNLRKTIRNHFEHSHDEEEFRNFMLSIKCKELVFKIMLPSTEEERKKEAELWKDALNPECTPELNYVY